MAQFPCDYSQHLFKGRAYYFYPAVGLGTSIDRRRFRLCPRHSAEATDWLFAKTHCEQREEDDQEDGLSRCAVCQDPVFRDGHYFFCTCFTERDQDTERHDFWALVHPECGSGVWDRFRRPQDEAEMASASPIDPLVPKPNSTVSRRK